jgi:hypothetical protein
MPKETVMMKRTMLVRLGLAVALVLAFGAGSAFADSVTFSLNNGNSAISGFAGPYGSVVVNLTDSTDATITFTSSGPYRFGDGGTAAVNVNGTFTVSSGPDESGSNNTGGFTPTLAGSGIDLSNGNQDGWGKFNLAINNFDGWPDSTTSVSFVVTNSSGSWSSAADVLIANNLGNEVSAHVFVPNSYPNPGTAAGGAVATGFATGSVVPEPTGMAIAGLGGLGLIGYGLRRRRAK